MLDIARNVIGLLGAVLLLVLLAFAAFILGRSNPGIHAGIFYGAAGVVYTMVVLFVLNR